MGQQDSPLIHRWNVANYRAKKHYNNQTCLKVKAYKTLLAAYQ